VRLRNDDLGYGVVTRTLHWLTVAALVAQVTVGYLIDRSGHGHGRGHGSDEGSGHGRGHGGGTELDDTTVRIHVALGCLVVLLAVVRLVWRRSTPLPPWSDRLTPRDRVVEHWVERVLLTLLLVTPTTGVLLLLSGEDDLLPAHVACHIALYLAVAVHVGLAVRRRTLGRMTTVGP
jgi:cytochrome b561